MDVSGWIWWVLLAAAVLAFAVYLWRLAVRIDNLHRRVANGRNSLERALVRRAAFATQLATSGLLSEQASQELRLAAGRALTAAGQPIGDAGGHGARADLPSLVEPRHLMESELSEALRGVSREDLAGGPAQDQLSELLWEELADSRYQVQVCRTVHNQDVLLVRELRARPLPRWFHLAGYAPLPQYVDLDDAT